MKKILLSLLVMSIVTVAHAQIVKGDMNNDGTISMTDANNLVNIFVDNHEYEYIDGVDNKAIVGTWYRNMTVSVAFGDDGTVTLENGNTYVYKYLPALKTLLLYDCNTGMSAGMRDVVSFSDEKMVVYDFVEASATTYYRMPPADNGSCNGHGYVDLGLPSGVMWANCNIGASAPEACGDYFAWGELEPKNEYTWENYKWCEGSYDTLTKYCVNSDYGNADNKTSLDAEDDAASANWSGYWHMPTPDEFQELIDNCSWTWTTLNGVDGYKVMGANGNFIFLPIAGRYDTSLEAAENGYYWTKRSPHIILATMHPACCLTRAKQSRSAGIVVMPSLCAPYTQ